MKQVSSTKGRGTHNVLPSFLLLAPSLLLPVAAYIMQFPPLDLRHVERLGGNARDFDEGFLGKPSSPGDGALYTCHGCAASQTPTAWGVISPSLHCTLVLVRKWNPQCLLRGKEQAGIAHLKPTNNTSNVAKAVCRAWNETCTSLPIYPILPLSLCLIWKQDTSLWVTSRVISEKPLLRAFGSWMRHWPCWSKPSASLTEASNWDKTRQNTSH